MHGHSLIGLETKGSLAKKKKKKKEKNNPPYNIKMATDYTREDCERTLREKRGRPSLRCQLGGGHTLITNS